MTTKRKRYPITDTDGTVKYLYTEVKRVIDGKVKQTTCCCKGAGESAEICRAKTGNKTRCRCFCHSDKHYREVEESKPITLPPEEDLP